MALNYKFLKDVLIINLNLLADSFMMENLTASNASNDLTQQGAAGSISNSKSNKRHLSDGGGGSTSSLQNSGI